MVTPVLLPGDPVPPLNLPLVGGGRFDLATVHIDRFHLVDVYRGMHCPRCRLHLSDLAHKLPALALRGVSAVAVSIDDASRAAKTVREWPIADVPIAYNMTLEDAAAWGLFVSDAIGTHEAKHFAEPATFLIAPDRTVYSIMLNSTPFARFHFADLLEGIDTIISRDYPPRGTRPHALVPNT